MPSRTAAFTAFYETYSYREQLVGAQKKGEELPSSQSGLRIKLAECLGAIVPSQPRGVSCPFGTLQSQHKSFYENLHLNVP